MKEKSKAKNPQSITKTNPWKYDTENMELC